MDAPQRHRARKDERFTALPLRQEADATTYLLHIVAGSLVESIITLTLNGTGAEREAVLQGFSHTSGEAVYLSLNAPMMDALCALWQKEPTCDGMKL
jgi:hypothetical protein